MRNRTLELRCSTTEPQRLYGKRGLLRSSCLTQILRTARISNVDSVMFVNRIGRIVSFELGDHSTDFNLLRILECSMVGCWLQRILLKRKWYLWATTLLEGVKFAHCVIQRGTSKDLLISAYPFVDRYLYLTKRLHLVDIPCNVIKMEIVSSPRGKVRRCFRGVFMTALFLNNNGTGFFLIIHFFWR